MLIAASGSAHPMKNEAGVSGLKPRGPFPTIVVFDQTLMRPACPLLQSVMGGLINSADLDLLTADGGEWLTRTTPDMKPYTIHTVEEFERVREVVRTFHGSTRGRRGKNDGGGTR